MAWVLWRDPKHGDVLHRRYQTKYGKDADEETEEDGHGGSFREGAQKGRPRRLRMAWVLWQDPKHGDVLRRYRTKYGKDADEETEEDGGTVDLFETEKGEEGDDEDDEDENDPSQGDLLQRKLRLAVAYLDELMDEEKSRLTECREKDIEECMIVYERALKGETTAPLTS
jgi:hypothetical protein